MNKVKSLLKARWMSSLIFLLLLFLITGIAEPEFLSYSNIISCFNTATMYTLLAIGIAFGLMLQEIGYNFIWAFFMSLTIYAGSGQYLGVTCWAPPPPWARWRS